MSPTDHPEDESAADDTPLPASAPGSPDGDDSVAENADRADADSFDADSFDADSFDADGDDSHGIDSHGIDSDSVDPDWEADDSIEDDPSSDDEFSLDDLGAAYARVAAEQDPDILQAPTEEAADESEIDPDETDETTEEVAEAVVTPEAIVEAALFVGHPENKPLSEQRLASLMRGVTPEEVVELIDRLNESYLAEDQALRIIRVDTGFRMTIAPAVESIRRSFLGKVREARLSQMAIEVLSLVAYQPGVTAQIVDDQRGRESGSLLNQLVRRQLLRMERVKPSDGGRAVPHYYPTERFLHLFSLESLEDLPQVEEGLRE